MSSDHAAASNPGKGQGRKLRGILALVVVFIVLPFGLLAILWKDRCKETRVAELSGGSGFVAATVVTDCGPSMKVATEVRLERLDEQGHPRLQETVLLVAGRTKLPITWVGPDHIRIHVPEGFDIVKRRSSWDGITIDFDRPPSRGEETAPPPAP